MQIRKVFVSVIACIDEDGNKKPLYIKWKDGRKFAVDKVTDIRRSCATKVGGTAIRYTVTINGRSTYLFEDDGKWFAESKE